VSHNLTDSAAAAQERQLNFLTLKFCHELWGNLIPLRRKNLVMWFYVLMQICYLCFHIVFF